MVAGRKGEMESPGISVFKCILSFEAQWDTAACVVTRHGSSTISPAARLRPAVLVIGDVNTCNHTVILGSSVISKLLQAQAEYDHMHSVESRLAQATFN